MINHSKKKHYLLAAILLTASFFSYAADIKNIRVWRAPDNTRLVFDLSGPTEHRLFSTQNEKGGERIEVVLPKATMLADEKSINLKNTPVSDFHVEKTQDGVKLVIDLSVKVKPKSFVLPPNDQYGDRLVLDLFDENKPSEVKIEKPASNGMRDIVIAVDAGHGGEDPGARSSSGIFEKDVTLAIAKELAQLINKTPGYSAVLTRSGDYFVSLRGRTQIARDKGADLFIAIHADAFKDSSAQGAGVFALSQRGATSETARWLAQSENESDLVGGVNLTDKDPMLQGVLLDLSMTATVATSLDMGDKVLKQMQKIAKMHRGFVEQAGFVVLKNPDIPSLLIETGFITNTEEARKLSTPTYRQKMAQSIFSGIDGYFRAKPPMDTALAAARGGKVKPVMDKLATAHSASNRRDMRLSEQDDMEKLLANNAMDKPIKPTKKISKKVAVLKEASPSPAAKHTVTYTVKKGDSLSSIAVRYKVSVQTIVEFNHLRNHSVMLGQTLRIPVVNLQ